jgi:hypothetical protein
VKLSGVSEAYPIPIQDGFFFAKNVVSSPKPQESEHMRIVGIDPGLSGGAFYFDTDSSEFTAYKLESNDGKIDVLKFCDWLSLNRPEHIFIEQIFLAGKEGGRSAITIGSNYGRLASCCEVLKIPYTEVMPKVWQRSLGLKGGSRKEVKDQAAKLAIQRFTILPFLKKSLKHHDGLTDAACITLYGINFLTENLWNESKSTKSTQTSASSTGMSAKRSSTLKSKRKPNSKPSKAKKKPTSVPTGKRDSRSAKSSGKLKTVGRS